MNQKHGKLTIINYLLETISPDKYKNFNLYENNIGGYNLTFEITKSEYDMIIESVNKKSPEVADIKIKTSITNILETINTQWVKIGKSIDEVIYVIDDNTTLLNESENNDNNLDINKGRIEQWLNKKMPETFDWWIKTEVESAHMMSSNVFVLKQNLEVESEWLYKQWKEYNYDIPFPDIEYGDEINLSEVIGPVLAGNLKEKIRQMIIHIVGVMPKYIRLVTFVTPVEREDIPDQIIDENKKH